MEKTLKIIIMIILAFIIYQISFFLLIIYLINCKFIYNSKLLTEIVDKIIDKTESIDIDNIINKTNNVINNTKETINRKDLFKHNHEREEQKIMFDMKFEQFIKKFNFVIVLVIILLVGFILHPIQTIVEGRVGVHYRLGKLYECPVKPGLHLSVPFIDYWDVLDVREKVYSYSEWVYGSDNQPIERFNVKVNYKFNENKLEYIIKEIGVNHIEEKLISTIVPSTVKNCVGKYTADKVVENRDKIEKDIYDTLKLKLDNSIILSRVNVGDIEHTDAFEKMVQEKIAAEQEALAVKNRTIKIEEEAKQEVVRAQAEADAKKIKADADAYEVQKIQEQLSKSPQYNDYIRAQKWDGKLPNIMGNTVNPWIAAGQNQ